MTIAVYGAGYVGLVSAVCFAHLGKRVVCVDVDEARVAALSQGQSPIHEDGLISLLSAQLASGRLSFTTDAIRACSESNIHVIATGTPSLDNGAADLSQVYAVVNILIEHSKAPGIIVLKSTVPIGSADEIASFVNQGLEARQKTHHLSVVSNPEFLREGSAVSDFLTASRIIVGGKPEAVSLLKAVYQPLIDQGSLFLSMSRVSAELSKYASNAMLACKISFINQISQLAQKTKANIDDIREAMSLDERIGPHFLSAGIGYGGSCFPKDVRALVQSSKSLGVDPSLLAAIDAVNEVQKTWGIVEMNRHFNHDLSGLKIGVWGVAFKPGTDDVREASSLSSIKAFLEAGAEIVVYDPIVDCQTLFAKTKGVSVAASSKDVLTAGIDALFIATEWPEFVNFPLSLLIDVSTFDGRNCFDLRAVAEAKLAHYYSVGRPKVVKGVIHEA